MGFLKVRTNSHQLKFLDVSYRTLWGCNNESEENRQRYDEARKEQEEMIRFRVDEAIYLLQKNITPIVSKDLKVWIDLFDEQYQIEKDFSKNHLE